MLCVYLRLRVCKCVCMRVCVCACQYSDFLSRGFKVGTLVSCYCDDGIWYHGTMRTESFGAHAADTLETRLGRLYRGCGASVVAAISVLPSLISLDIDVRLKGSVADRFWEMVIKPTTILMHGSSKTQRSW